MSATDPVIPDVKVSVCMITYNHERFIAQAIESVMMQETDFRVELVIGEDCSTDGTRAIVVKYAQRYPDRIRPLLPDHNLGMMPNFVATMQACGGQYIALLEGDDYWTNPHKLQKQVEFLEAHPECSMCFHEAYDVWPDGSKALFVRSRSHELKHLYTLDDVVIRYFIPTASMVLRKALTEELPAEFFQVPGADWFMHVLLARSGYLCFIDETWSAYRWHVGGVMSYASRAAQLGHTMDTAFLIDRYLDGSYSHLLRPYVLKHLIELVAILTAHALTDGTTHSVLEVIRRKTDSCSDHLALSSTEANLVASSVAQKLTYMFHERGDLARVRECWLASFRWPAHLPRRNRGFWSIGVTAFLGQECSDNLRRAFRMLESGHLK